MTGTIILLGALIVAVTLAFVVAWLGLHWLYEQARDRYQARRKHVATATPPRRVFERTGKPGGDKAQREAAYGELRETPEPGKDIYTDHTVRLPFTPTAALYHAAHGTAPIVADITDARPPRPVLPGCDLCGSYSHWTAQHDTASATLHAFQPEPETTLDVADSTFVKALFALPLDRVAEAFEGLRSA